jgi:hypothetical protein
VGPRTLSENLIQPLLFLPKHSQKVRHALARFAFDHGVFPSSSTSGVYREVFIDSIIHETTRIQEAFGEAAEAPAVVREKAEAAYAAAHETVRAEIERRAEVQREINRRRLPQRVRGPEGSANALLIDDGNAQERLPLRVRGPEGSANARLIDAGKAQERESRAGVQREDNRRSLPQRVRGLEGSTNARLIDEGKARERKSKAGKSKAGKASLDKTEAFAELQRLHGGLWDNRYTHAPMWWDREWSRATPKSTKKDLNAWVVAATAALSKNPIAVMVPAHQVQTGSSIPMVTATNVTSAAAVSAAETARAAAMAGEGGRAGMEDAAFPFGGSGRPATTRGGEGGGTVGGGRGEGGGMHETS